jgi:DNA-binding CsgD family transcriptional regulator/tetratricopeptide (TPR) repeat protein
MGGVAGQEGRFIGRETALASLAAAMEGVMLRREPATVLVLAEAGMGKSRLVREFLATLADRPARVTTYTGRCPPAGTGSAYWPLAEVLRDATGTSLETDATRAAAALRRHVRKHVSAGSRRDEMIHALAVSAGMRLPRNPLDDAEPRAVDAAIRRAWPRYLAARARPTPVVMVIEDVHWADRQLLRAVESIEERAAAPVLIVATARAELMEHDPGFTQPGKKRTVLQLPSLSREEGEELVRDVLRAPQLPASIARAMAARAEGNPLHIEETIRLLADTRAIERSGSAFVRVLDTARVVASPTGIADLLAARVEALPAAERRVLQLAAVVGRRFWEEGVSAAAEGKRTVLRELIALERRDLVAQRSSSSLGQRREYAFKHVLIRDAAYETMPRGRRARAHGAVGAWLEQIASNRPAQDELVAEHYRLAVLQGDEAAIWKDHLDEREELRTRAFRHLVSAGRSARRQYALDRAIVLHHQAEELAESPPERAEALDELGEDHETGLRGEEALQAYRAALAIARQGGVDAERRAQICMKAARTLVLRWGAFTKRPDPAEMDALIDEGLAATSEPVTRSWLLALVGATGVRWEDAGQGTDPVPMGQRIEKTRLALREATSIGEDDLAGFVARVLGQLEFAEGHYREARQTMRSVLPLLPRMRSTFQRALTSMYVFLSLADVEGQYEDALELAGDTLELGREMSPHEHMHGTFGKLWALHHLGRWSEMAEYGEEHLDALAGEDQMVCPYVRSGPLVWALTLANLGDRDGVDRVVGRIMPTWESPGLPEMLLARISAASGDLAHGRQLAEQIIESGRVPSLEENAFDKLTLVEALQGLGDWDGLRDALHGARRWEPALAIMRPTCDRAQGLAALARDDRGAGMTYLRRAAAGFERLGIRYELARTKALLAHAMPDPGPMLAEAMAAAEPLITSASQTSLMLPGTSGGEPLTHRETQVIAHVAEGLDNRAIAARLLISTRTVERHLANIYAKLGVSGKAARAAATARAYEAGLIGLKLD